MQNDFCVKIFATNFYVEFAVQVENYFLFIILSFII